MDGAALPGVVDWDGIGWFVDDDVPVLAGDDRPVGPKRRQLVDHH